MSARKHAITAGVLLSLVSHMSLAQTDAGKALLEQGLYWQAQGNKARAAEVWNKLLVIEPGQTRAIYGLGLIEVENMRLDQATVYLEQLKKIDPNSREALLLAQAISLKSGDSPAALNAARLLQESGDFDQAIEKYKKIFNGNVPQGDIALEYYRFLGSAKNGWEPARQGLERLNRETPNDPMIMLALATLLSRNESTRADGINRLAKLTNVSSVRGYAEENWRMALIWYGASAPDSAVLFETFLKSHPDDTEIRDMLAAGKKQRLAQAKATTTPVQSPLVSAGLKALGSGDRAQAERAFLSRLESQPNDPDALGGLGVLRLEQNNLDQAHALLVRATQQKGGSSWNVALNDVNLLILVDQANSTARGGDLVSARKMLERAIKMNPKQTAAENALANLLAESGDLNAAEQAYRRVLARNKNDAQALSGLVAVLAANDKLTQSRQLLDRLTPEQVGGTDAMNKLRAAYANGVAKAALRRGDEAGAREAFEEAMRGDRENPWIRLELAELYLRNGRSKEASGLVDGLLITQPTNPAALYASASIAAARGEYAVSLATLDRVLPADRSDNIAALQKRVWIQNQAARASSLARQGNKSQALAVLAQIERQGGDSPAFIGIVAGAYADAGESSKALSMLRKMMARQPNPEASTLLQYASVLLKTNQDVECAGILTDLQKKVLSATDRKSYDDMLYLYSVRQAQILQDRSDLAAAYDRLTPLLAQRPDDVQANLLLARMYASIGEKAKALEVIKPLVQKNPDNQEAQLGAAQVAIQIKENNFADTALERVLVLASEDPQAIAAVARIYRSQGKTGKAADLFERAVALEKTAGVAPVLIASQGTQVTPSNSSNPFTNKSQNNSGDNLAPVGPQIGAQPQGTVPQTVTVAMGDSTPSQYRQTTQQSGSMTAVQPQVSQVAMIPSPASATAPISSGSASQTLPANNRVPTTQLTPAISQPDIRSGSNPFGSTTGAVASTYTPISTELDQIRQVRSPEILAGVQVRNRNGSPGTSQLTDTEAPVEIRIPAGDGKASLQITPVSLNAGTIGSDYYSRSIYGAGPQSALNQLDGLTGSPDAQKASGLGLAVGYKSKGVAIDGGVTPVGFTYSNFTGGLKLDGTLDDANTVSYLLNVSSRPVTDSMLSFAGTKDNVTGQSWGGVMASGARIQLTKDLGGFGLTGAGSWYSLDGHNVASNSRTEASGGMYLSLLKTPDSSLSTGFNINGVFYDKNLSNFTYGQGGYFSPQTYYAFTVPLTWSARQDKFSYLLRAALGVQHYTQDASDYFPTNSAMQGLATIASAEAYTRGLTGSTLASYPSQSQTGVAYNLSAAGEYQLVPQLFIGGTLELNNASNYRQWGAGAYLRYSFYSITQQMALPVSPYISPYGQ
ncbi:MAG: cellulose synthase subunit BcsC-related outer membrane protein [Sheuella sp.]|nr:cellulose synthase subunit BcsC-related outer membrane protein [Sheuella sp.]